MPAATWGERTFDLKRWRAEARDVEASAERDEKDDAPVHVADPVIRYSVLGIFLILLIAGLKISQTIAMPVMAGIILGLVFGPLADRIGNWGVPRGLVAAVLVIAFVTLMLLAAGALAAPLTVWADRIPEMVAVLRAKFAGMFEFARMLDTVSSQTAGGQPGQTVIVDDRSAPWMQIALTSGTAAGGFLLSVFTMYFYLATRRLMKARALRLCLGHEARKSAGAFFDRIEDRVAHYLVVVTAINLGLGVATGLVAWGGGLAYPVAWAAFAALMNYIPLVGPLVVTAALVAAGLLMETSTFAALWPAAVYFAFHLIEGQAVTPALVGRRLTISPLLIFLSFAFWLWLWGPVGAILATPILLLITVAAEVLGEYRENVEAAAS